MKNKISVYRVKLEKLTTYHLNYDAHSITKPDVAADIFRNYMDNFCSTDRENFVVMFLNTKMRIVGISTAHVGSLDASIVHPREIYTEALLHKAASIIVCHNHPSGDPTPSREDFSMTTILQEAGDLLQIPVLDHIILGEERFYSMKKNQDM